MGLRLRLIPLTIVVASLFLVIKLLDLVQGSQQLSEALLVDRVQAEEKPAESKPAPEKPPEHGSEEPAKQEEAKKEEGNPNVSDTPGDVTERRFTPVELELLQKLSNRRSELDAWEGNLQIKEKALEATEQRIDEKIAQVEAMKKAVNEALAEYNKIEDREVASLVKIYENMKPVDAARIFDELDRPILLLIVDRMSEKKASPILAAMDSARAKQLTVDLAEQRRLKTPKKANGASATNGNGNTPTPPPSTGQKQ